MSEIDRRILTSFGLNFGRRKAPRLLSLCLGVLGRNLEDIVEDLVGIAATFPSDVKMALAAIARRRKILNDDILVALADSSWQLLDISGSNVTDFGLAKVAMICKNLRAADMSQCDKITVAGVSDLVSQCHSLEILRLGGCPSGEFTARQSLGIFKPKLKVVEEDSWEELDVLDIANGAQSLRWLVWPKIDDDSLRSLAAECPRIIINPWPSPLGIHGVQVPTAALPGKALDELVVEDIDPKTWAVSRVVRRNSPPPIPNAESEPELPMAERFRLAFVERDMRLAPKRAKNVRQHQRRAEREWLMKSTDAKSVALASQASRHLHNRS